MKASTRYNILLLAGAVFGYVSLFHRMLGLPDWVQIFVPVTLICVCLPLWLQYRAKRRNDPSVAIAAPMENQRSPTPTSRETGLRLLMLFLIIIVSVSGPWWLPYAGVHLGFPQLVLTSLISCAICVAMWLIGWWRANRKA
jgi:hypothetical protein